MTECRIAIEKKMAQGQLGSLLKVFKWLKKMLSGNKTESKFGCTVLSPLFKTNVWKIREKTHQVVVL